MSRCLAMILAALLLSGCAASTQVNGGSDSTRDVLQEEKAIETDEPKDEDEVLVMVNNEEITITRLWHFKLP